MSFFPYTTVSEFFEAEGDFEENLNPDEEIEEAAERLGWPTDPYLTGDDEPCCFLYREMYAEDHEYGCYRRVKHDNQI